MLHEFREFLTKSNALALALGVIIGAATGKVVTAIVDDIVMPLVSMLLPAGDWRDAQLVLSQHYDSTGKLTVSAIKYGHFLGATIDFLCISFIVFLIAKMFFKEVAIGAVPPK
jgi:large conductance mechanosensitive channel